ncbi:MAG: hypothetical protein M1504_01210 [Candidatus Marsarchaeota archaeon]|nr:hypothetical protein [Candidatus Marsarchaeota archaeon]
MVLSTKLPMPEDIARSKHARILFLTELSKEPGLGRKEAEAYANLAKGLRKEMLFDKVEEFKLNPMQTDMALDIMVTAMKEFSDDKKLQEELCEQITAVDPTPISDMILGFMLKGKNDVLSSELGSKAIAECERLFARTHNVAYVEMAVAMIRNEPHESSKEIDIIDRAIADVPDSPVLWELRAEAFENNNNWAASISDYDKALGLIAVKAGHATVWEEQMMFEMQIRHVIAKIRALSARRSGEASMKSARTEAHAATE